MKWAIGLLWALLAVSVGLVKVVNVFLGVDLPVVDLAELTWAMGDEAGSREC
jgi:hypothetical protein